MDRPLQNKKLIKPKHIWIAAFVIFIVASIAWIAFADHSAVYRVERDRVTIEKVSRGVFNDYIRVIGEAEPITTVYIDVVEGGRVEEKYVEEGTTVTRGQVILKLSNQQLRLNLLNADDQLNNQLNILNNFRVEMAQSAINHKQEQLEMEYDILRKKREYEQNQLLYEDELISSDEYLKSKENYEFAEKSLVLLAQRQQQDSLLQIDQLKQLQNKLAIERESRLLAQERLDNLILKAPVDGLLGLLDAEIGEAIPVGKRIGQVHDLSSYKVVAEIDEHYIDRVKPLLLADIDRQGVEHNLSVRKVYPEVREGRFEIDLVFSDSLPPNIRSGQTFNIRLQLGASHEATLLPRGGFYQNTGGQWIFAVNDKEGAAFRRVVRIGRQNPNFYEVLEGLEPGDEVVISSYDTFGDCERLIFK